MKPNRNEDEYIWVQELQHRMAKLTVKHVGPSTRLPGTSVWGKRTVTAEILQHYGKRTVPRRWRTCVRTSSLQPASRNGSTSYNRLFREFVFRKPLTPPGSNAGTRLQFKPPE